MVQVIEQHPDRRKNAFLFLTTGGGDPNGAYRIGRALKRNYTEGKLSIFIGGYCKSAGTLLALCADELVFTMFGELGPLDVQIGKPNELVGADSGLDLSQSLEHLSTLAFESFEQQLIGIISRSGGAISTKVAAEIASSLTVGIFNPIFAQVEPLRLGFSWRANQIGLQYGNQLACSNVKPGTVHKLVNGYPAHEFVIDEGEASQLFERVRHSSEVESKIFDRLSSILRVPADEPVISAFRLDLSEEEASNQPDTANPGKSDILEENYEQSAQSNGKPGNLLPMQPANSEGGARNDTPGGGSTGETA